MKKILAIVMTFVGISFVSQNYFNPFITVVLFLLYGILRWKLAEAEILYVKNKITLISIRVFLVFFSLSIFSGAGHFGGAMPEKMGWIGSIVVLIGLVLAYEVIRFWKNIKIIIETENEVVEV